MPDSQKHLLLVEDETSLRRAVAEQLADRGYRVEQADSGEAGEEVAPDLGVMVANLAVIDGSEEFASSEDQGAAESAPESSETGSEQPIRKVGHRRPTNTTAKMTPRDDDSGSSSR